MMVIIGNGTDHFSIILLAMGPMVYGTVIWKHEIYSILMHCSAMCNSSVNLQVSADISTVKWRLFILVQEYLQQRQSLVRYVR